jgi:hypothetical protein
MLNVVAHACVKLSQDINAKASNFFSLFLQPSPPSPLSHTSGERGEKQVLSFTPLPECANEVCRGDRLGVRSKGFTDRY